MAIPKYQESPQELVGSTQLSELTTRVAILNLIENFSTRPIEGNYLLWDSI